MNRLALLIVSVIFAASHVVSAACQTIGQNARPNGDGVMTLSVQSHLVTEAVTVKEKNGKFIPGLTAKDFTRTEDNVPQKVRFCEHQNLSTERTPLPALDHNDDNIKVYRTLSRSQIAPEQTEDLRHKDRLLMVLYFDLSAMDLAEQYRAFQAAQTFIRTQMSPADSVLILRFNTGSVDVLQDFTADRNRLLSILATMAVGENQEWATGQSDNSAVDTGAAFGQDDSEFNIFNTDRQLSALQTAADMLGHLNEKKSSSTLPEVCA